MNKCEISGFVEAAGCFVWAKWYSVVSKIFKVHIGLLNMHAVAPACRPARQIMRGFVHSDFPTLSVLTLNFAGM